MKSWLCTLYLCICILLVTACDSGETSSGTPQQNSLPPREATDPVPEPPIHTDSSSGTAQETTSSLKNSVTATRTIYYQLIGTEPFWSLTLGRPYSTFRSMEGDSLSFVYAEPRQVAGRQEDWVQLFTLGNTGWALLRRAPSPCSDGMSDKEWAYTATVLLNGNLLDGCAEKQ